MTYHDMIITHFTSCYLIFFLILLQDAFYIKKLVKPLYDMISDILVWNQQVFYVPIYDKREKKMLDAEHAGPNIACLHVQRSRKI